MRGQTGAGDETKVRAWFDAAPHRAMALWGKATPSSGDGEPAHPLLFHMLDVAAVACELAGTASRSIRHRIDAALGSGAKNGLAFIVALHDLGKASPAFQRKWHPATEWLSAAGLELGSASRNSRPHGELAVQLASDALSRHLGVRSALAWRLARAVAAHHGELANDLTARRAMRADERGPTAAWVEAREWLAATLADVVGPLAPIPDEAALERDPAFHLLLAGLTSVADWLGSMNEVFRYEPPSVRPCEYWHLARARAVDALRSARWQTSRARPSSRFVDLFPGYTPWPLHEAVEAAASVLESPSVVVIEAPMGEGKTEAALYLSDAFAARFGQEGLFFGLPTQATANQMLRRTEDFLARTRGGASTNLQLVHGEALLSDDFARLRRIYDDGGAGGVRAEEWFTRRKRALLATAAVGTVDQALLGVLRVRHGFVRLFGLAGKTVVFDEVHAYDTYTSRLIDRTIEWLHALGASVVILSATLPRARREALLGTVGASGHGDPTPYPRLSVATPGRVQVIHVASRKPPVAVAIERRDDSLEEVAGRLGQLVAGGGCAGWICNTVARAQEAYRLVRAARVDGRLGRDTALLLLHSRYPAGARQTRERQLTDWLGRDGIRPARAIVIGTQVFEQSLDVDFDVLATDLAPVDLVLQRAGRLHRHDGRARPAAVSTPRLVVVGATGDRPPVWATAERAVYSAFPQWRTFLALQSRDALTLPGDIEPLIEEVYRQADEDDPAPVREAAAREIRKREHDDFLALQRVLPSPGDGSDPLNDFAAILEEDSPDIHEQLQAQTRLGAPAVDVVCLHRRAGELYLDPGGSDAVSLVTPPSRELARELMSRTVGLSHRGLVPRLLSEPTPTAWADVAVLAGRRALVFDDCVAVLGAHQVVYDEDLGLVISQSEE